jgi:hypothetical protein
MMPMRGDEMIHGLREGPGFRLGPPKPDGGTSKGPCNGIVTRNLSPLPAHEKGSVLMIAKTAARVFLVIGMASSFGHADSSSTTNKTKAVGAQRAAEQFCQAEFAGIVDIRQSLVRYSPTRRDLEKAKDPELEGLVISIEADPVFVVDSYRITEVTVGKRATATILYRRLARSQGEGLPGRELVPDCRNEDSVKLTLQYAKGRWYIIDPPPPRISREVLIEYYQNSVQQMEGWINSPTTSRAQKQAYQIEKDTLKTISSLDCSK